jgi:hypothetical protein
MAMVKMARIAGLAAALCFVTAAPAHAAFSPDLTVGLAPATAAGSPELTATVVQPATDTAIERFTLTLPAGFSAAGAPAASACTLALVRAGTCPPATQIGLFAVQVGASAPATGTIHKTGANSFGLFVSALGGAVSQTVEGSLVQRASGALDLKLDQLPALPLTGLALRLWGGQWSLIRTPGECGNYTLDGKFTSRLGEFAIDRTLMAISGCAGAPTVTVANARLSDTRFKAGGSVYGTRTTIEWWASQAADHTTLRIERRVDGTWRAVGGLVANGNAGDNFVRWDGRVRNRILKPGRYALRIQPAGSAPAQRVRFRIVD